jgi:hypothetical protein
MTAPVERPYLGASTMVDDEWDDDDLSASRFSLRSVLIGNWPYFTMLILGVFGVALTSFARPAVTTFWLILCPVFGIICVAARWREVDGREAQWLLIRQQVIHWLAIMFAISLVFVSEVKQMMNADASALMVMTILALGTFIAGNYSSGGWRISLVGFQLALGVPAVAWLEQSTLLLVLVGGVLIGLAVMVFSHYARHGKSEAY